MSHICSNKGQDRKQSDQQPHTFVLTKDKTENNRISNLTFVLTKDKTENNRISNFTRCSNKGQDRKQSDQQPHTFVRTKDKTENNWISDLTRLF